MAVLGREHQRRAPLPVAGVNGGAGLEQKPADLSPRIVVGIQACESFCNSAVSPVNLQNKPYVPVF